MKYVDYYTFQLIDDICWIYRVFEIIPTSEESFLEESLLYLTWIQVMIVMIVIAIAKSDSEKKNKKKKCKTKLWVKPKLQRRSQFEVLNTLLQKM